MKFSLCSVLQCLTGALALLTLTTGCSKKSSDDFTVGFIYIDRKDDYGYSQAHAQGAAEVKKLPGVKVLEVEKVPETDAAQQTMKTMIDVEGAKVIFASSFGYYDKHVIPVAKLYPNVKFLHCGGAWTKGTHPDNCYTYFGYIDECQYISGIVAGLTTKTNKLGFIAAKPIPQVRRNINAFLLGARSVNPNAEVHVIFTGNWNLPKEEADSTKILIAKGCDVFTCHVDSPKVVVETATGAGKYVCGYHANQSELSPSLYLTGAEWNWQQVYVDFVKKLQAGETIPNYTRGGLKEGIVKMSPYGPGVSEEAKKKADAAKAKLMAGGFVIFKGPLTGKVKTKTGVETKVVVPAGTELQQNDPVLEDMNYLLEGVVGGE